MARRRGHPARAEAGAEQKTRLPERGQAPIASDAPTFSGLEQRFASGRERRVIEVAPNRCACRHANGSQPLILAVTDRPSAVQVVLTVGNPRERVVRVHPGSNRIEVKGRDRAEQRVTRLDADECHSLGNALFTSEHVVDRWRARVFTARERLGVANQRRPPIEPVGLAAAFRSVCFTAPDCGGLVDWAGS